MNQDIVVKTENLGKKFKLYENPQDRLKEWLSFGLHTTHSEFWALKGISIKIKQGECFGVIGENGAGKSTLLKILTRALHPTIGSIDMKGRVLSLLELGTGFNMELTGKENILNNASLLGFPDNYITNKKLDLIEEFADIGMFFHQPVKTYSSGMHIRLAFSMFMFMEPEIFIIDEALTVGDIFFTQKCLKRIRELMTKGTTFIFVSHDLKAIQNLSSQVMLLKNGICAFKGKPEEAVARYHTIKNNHSLKAEDLEKTNKTITVKSTANYNEDLSFSILNGRDRHGNGEMEILAAKVTNSRNVNTLTVSLMEDLIFYLHLKANRSIKDPNFGIIIHDNLGNLVFSCSTSGLGNKIPKMEMQEKRVVAFKIKMSLSPGEYTFALVCGHSAEDLDPNRGVTCDRHNSLGPLVVLFDYSKSAPPFYGIAQLPMEIIMA